MTQKHDGMSKGSDAPESDENYLCQIVIPSIDYRKSRIFFERAFGWNVQESPVPGVLDVLPPYGKGPSAELNSDEEAIVPVILTKHIERKLKVIKEHGGRILKGKTPVDINTQHGFYAIFEDPHGNRTALYQEE